MLAYLDPHWYYCWNTQPPQEIPPPGVRQDQSTQLKNAKSCNVEFLPMFWGYCPQNFKSQVQLVVARQPIMILGFNEPDHKDQSNISVQRALQGWRILQEAVEQVSAADVLLVSPSCADSMGSWMINFMNVVEKLHLRVDIIGVHYYGCPNVQVFQTRMQKIYETYGRRPILITEFGVADWQAKSVTENRFTTMQVLTFMEAVLPWIESQDWILGYNWFPFNITSPPGTSSALWNEHGHLTAVGKYYSLFRRNVSSGCQIS
jgi:hypothetical protein